ncbi:unnamed protein product [Prorocentrum cordatum]|uniref:EF-hand domain-containing protein n=1 Tax=Prorocentrum cordatum TaxID=2364126 RepID=A0ABN9W9Y3_9DINO|nr:unnamed protein product [Polarella glacialis]
MTRVKNVGQDEFKDLVRHGYPFIVDDCVPEDAELRELACSEYGRRWPKEHMKAEYTRGQEHINLGDSDWHSVQKPTAKAKKHMSRGKPLSGPYIWHVKDETDDPQTKTDIQRMFPVPYFLNSSALNYNEVKDSFEFWFVLENGGSQAHADAYCETTISMQLRGSKKWRLGAFPNITNAFQPYGFHDSEIYRHSSLWRPEHEETVDPGSCVVFPMGYIHETYVAEGKGGDDGCSVASTFQFQDPQPIYQWKNFLARWGLSHYTRDEPCLQRMQPYVFLGKPWGVGLKGEAARAKIRERFREVDKNLDDALSYDELLELFRQLYARFHMPWTQVLAEAEASRVRDEKQDWVAEDAFLFHDDDGDGTVTYGEFEHTLLRFEAVRQRAKDIKRHEREPEELFARERDWITRHMCTDSDCEALKQLDKDFAPIGKRLAARAAEEAAKEAAKAPAGQKLGGKKPGSKSPGGKAPASKKKASGKAPGGKKSAKRFIDDL